jgi:ATP-dependent DNA helicase HFM1/MER3
VAVSATLPNIEDIAEFLTANEAHVFDESYRPVPLTTHVVALGNSTDASQGQYRFWNGLNREVPPIIHKFSKKRPTIVFCHSKKDTEQLADLLATARGIALVGNANGRIASETRVMKLQRVLMAGMAFHHAGMEADDRRLVERAFSSGKIKVLCATSTLAMGVNLPAHLVVIKGTKAWRGSESGYQELDQATLLQMIGR